MGVDRIGRERPADWIGLDWRGADRIGRERTSERTGLDGIGADGTGTEWNGVERRKGLRPLAQGWRPGPDEQPKKG